MQVCFDNEGVFSSSFSIQWNGGQTSQTAVLLMGQTLCIDLTPFNIPDGTSCWARAYIMDGPTHDSKGGFISFMETPTVTYTLSGSIFDPGFDCNGCS